MSFNKASFRDEISSIDGIFLKLLTNKPSKLVRRKAKKTQLSSRIAKLVTEWDTRLETKSPRNINIEVCTAKRTTMPPILIQSLQLRGMTPKTLMIKRLLKIPTNSGSDIVKIIPRNLPTSTWARETALESITLSVPRVLSPEIASKVNKMAPKLRIIPMNTQSVWISLGISAL